MRKKIIILFSGICFFVALIFIVFNFIIFPTKYKNLVVGYSKEYELDCALVYAIIKTESNFDKKATSSAGAMGLMQIMPTTGEWLAKEVGLDNFVTSELYDPEINIRLGCCYLNYLSKKFNDFKAVICAYNAGEGVVKNWIDENGKLVESKINYKETRNYLKKVVGYYNIYKNHEICN